MQEQFFVQFKPPTDIHQVDLILRSSGVFQPAVDLLDAESRVKYLPFLTPVQSRARGIVRSILVCTLTTVFGLMAVILDDVGFILSLCAVIVIWLTLQRKPNDDVSQVLSVRIDQSDAEKAKTALVKFGALAILGPGARPLI